jgi:hypothetical protein
MWLLIGDEIAQWGCIGSEEDVVAQWGSFGLLGYMVAHFGML